MACDTGPACSSECWSNQKKQDDNDNTSGDKGCGLTSCMSGCSVCSSSCGNGCKGGCSGTCSGGCKGTCTNECAQQCSNSCSAGCVGNCNYGCTSEEVNKLIENLHLSRIAESDDINALKKIIFRLFENLKISTIYKNQDYINEFGDNTIAGLVNNWNEDKDGKMTFTLLLNKTFETIITNLNNLNQNRINIDQNKMNPIKIWTVEIPDPNDFTKTKTIQLNTVDRNAALYWIECLKNIYNLVAPVK